MSRSDHVYTLIAAGAASEFVLVITTLWLKVETRLNLLVDHDKAFRSFDHSPYCGYYSRWLFILEQMTQVTRTNLANAYSITF